jgi:hypothetical protein
MEMATAGIGPRSTQSCGLGVPANSFGSGNNADTDGCDSCAVPLPPKLLADVRRVLGSNGGSLVSPPVLGHSEESPSNTIIADSHRMWPASLMSCHDDMTNVRYLAVAVKHPQQEGRKIRSSNNGTAVETGSNLWILNCFTKRWRCTFLDILESPDESIDVCRFVSIKSTNPESVPKDMVLQSNMSALSGPLRSIQFVFW